MINFISYRFHFLKAYFDTFLCKFFAHENNPPIIEVSETRNGIQKSIYLCRRCYTQIGEKPYA